MLVSLLEAKQQLGIPNDDASSDNLVALYAEAASDAVLSYLELATSPPYYTAATAPARVQHAVLLLVARYHVQRGDDEGNDEVVWKAVKRLLTPSPALA